MSPPADRPGRRLVDREVVVGGEEQLLLRAYTAYNTQDVDALLAVVSDDVDWPDGPTRLRGTAAVCAYWTQQWTRTHTRDQPFAIQRRPDGRLAVCIDQVVRSLDGAVVSTGSCFHVHRIEGHRIVRMDIEDL